MAVGKFGAAAPAPAWTRRRHITTRMWGRTHALVVRVSAPIPGLAGETAGREITDSVPSPPHRCRPREHMAGGHARRHEFGPAPGSLRERVAGPARRGRRAQGPGDCRRGSRRPVHQTGGTLRPSSQSEWAAAVGSTATCVFAIVDRW